MVGGGRGLVGPTGSDPLKRGMAEVTAAAKVEDRPLTLTADAGAG